MRVSLLLILVKNPSGTVAAPLGRGPFRRASTDGEVNRTVGRPFDSRSRFDDSHALLRFPPKDPSIW